jgi:hypothetical protein
MATPTPNAWNNPGGAPFVDPKSGRYDALYAFWEGSWRHSNMFVDQRLNNTKLYKNTRQLWRQAAAIVALYGQYVYAGNSLSTNTEPLSDGTRGAIPIDPQTNDDGKDDALRAAIAEWWTMTNYRQVMSMRPKFGAMLGDCLTELVDQRARGVVRPQIVWPGYVKYLDLDLSGNVQGYSVEWEVPQVTMVLYGERIQRDAYTFRKDVNGDGFFYYRNGEIERVEPNPYGFVPAVWDRHEIVFGDRGLSALDKTYQQAVELNSVLSHAMDHLQKNYGTPVGVKGMAISNRQDTLKMLNARNSTGDPLGDAALVAQSLGILPMSDNGDFITAKFDTGHVNELLGEVKESSQAENPEGSFSQQILEMTQVTAPGVERALGPIIGLVKDARKNYDTQTIKLIQMAITMTGWRVLTNGYPPELMAARQARYETFRPFDLGAFGRGDMDFVIPDREVIPDTIDERIARQLQIEQLTWPYSWQVAGVPEDVRKKLEKEQTEDRERQAKLDEFAVVGPGGDNVDEEPSTGETDA